MNTLPLVLDLIIAQGLMGAFDTLYHHELRAALPRQPGAALELQIHAGRSIVYGLLFAGLAWLTWGGVWLLLLAAMLLTEVVLTLWDFLVEDRSRILPPAERVLHTLMALNGGAAFALLCLFAPLWWRLPSRLQITTHGWQSLVMSVFAVGVVVSAVRDARAGSTLAKRGQRVPDIRFADTAQSLLITGGTGFIGQELCRALLADGHELTLLSRDPLKTSYLFEGRVHCIARLEDLDPGTRFDVVINLAGERILGPRWSSARKLKLAESRVGTTRSLAAWIARSTHKPRLMISASAVGYYGVQAEDDRRALGEDAASGRDFVSELCRQWEGAAQAVTSHGVALAITRFGVVLGHKGALPMMRLPFLFGLGGRIGSGRQVMNWVHVEDVLYIIAHLMSRADAQGVYNVAAPQSVTQSEFARTLARVLHRPCLLPTPAGVIRFVLGEQAMLLLEGQRVCPAHLERDGYRFHFPQLEAALRDLC
ncbi:MAG TPA: TIGR01777 family oxidoreductase [Candidatus Angelobacter sp.]|jgi:hypothetical protein|nr:TIGR01777 family oxidoreductase [Candidatus Angelobacter sp.]